MKFCKNCNQHVQPSRDFIGALFFFLMYLGALSGFGLSLLFLGGTDITTFLANLIGIFINSILGSIMGGLVYILIYALLPRKCPICKAQNWE